MGINNIAEGLLSLSVDIDSVILDPRNAMGHPQENIEAIKMSLEKYGQRKPIVVNKIDNTIEAGNGMWTAAKELSWTKIAVVFVRDDITTATGFAVADNRTAQLSGWNYDVLAEILESFDERDEQIPGIDKDFMAEVMASASGGIGDLDEMEKEYQEPEEADFWPFIRIQVHPDTKKLLDEMMEEVSGATDGEKFQNILSAVDRSAFEL